jgi:glycosyltransferase involved in cell wall biosynthesis
VAKKKILVFGYHDITRDPRTYRQAKWLKEDYDVQVISQIFDESLGVRFIEYPSAPYLQRKLRLSWLAARRFERYTWHEGHRALAERLARDQFDLIIVHHLNLLPIACQVAGGARVILDAHEFYTEIYDDSRVWRLLMKPYFQWLARTYLPKVDLVIGVNASMEKFYRDRYGVPSSYVTNAAEYHDLHPGPVDPHRIRLVHHGLASRSRRLEAMIDVMRHVDERFTLTILLLKLNVLGSSERGREASRT